MDTFIVANWKMNGSRALVSELVGGLVQKFTRKNTAGKKIVLCPPYPLLDPVLNLIKDTPLQLGAQNCSREENGAYTGDVSAEILKDEGCNWVILGHSERRHGLGESSILTAQKMEIAQDMGLSTIVCIGETKLEHDQDKTLDVLKAQLDESLPKSTIVEKTVVAYEPVWAIGTGVTPSPEEANAIHETIREHLLEKFQTYAAIPILYGGSVKAENASEFMAQPFINGVLVGGASLKLDQISQIIEG